MTKAKSNLIKALKTSALAITAVGLGLMVMKIVADSEPGAIPLAMTFIGAVTYSIIHFRIPSSKM